MTDSPNPTPAPPEESPEFGALVFQLTQMGLMLLGHGPDPEGKESAPELEQAQFVIGQLAMLEKKTRGNLTPAEAALLKQSLTTLRMDFVEAVEKAQAKPAAPAASATTATPAPEAAPAADATTASSSHEDKVRFSKKY